MMRTIPAVLEHSQPALDCDAVIDAYRTFTYRQFLNRCRRIGGLLDDLGVLRNERVAILARNSVPYIECYLGIPASGRVVVPLNTRWSDTELQYALVDSDAKVLFTDRNVNGLVDMVERVVHIDTGEYDQALILTRLVPFREDVWPVDIAGLFYTGGTTGPAKGVMLTHGNLCANAETMRAIAPLALGDTFCVVAPMFHAAGTTSVLYAVAAGARQVVASSRSPGSFDPYRVLDAIERERVTHTLVVPTMLDALVDEQRARPRRVDSLRVLMHGGSPITPALVERAAATFPDATLVHLYGTTETSPIVSALHDTTTSTSVGVPIGCDVRLADDGEVQVHGRNVMAGYWNRPLETAAALHDGWYSTGDLGYLDAVGRLHILDRKHDLIITGGENVYPSEVEAVLCEHPAVAEAAVYGVLDDRWGEIVCAAIVLRASVVNVGELALHCRIHLASYKVPQTFVFVDALPKSPAGKVLRRALR